MQDIAQFVQLAQALCYDLARAEKATDGKKRPGWPSLLRNGLSGKLAGERDTSSATFRRRACSVMSCERCLVADVRFRVPPHLL